MHNLCMGIGAPIDHADAGKRDFWNRPRGRVGIGACEMLGMSSWLPWTVIVGASGRVIASRTSG